jgi:RNA polymerase sigma-70 factor (ECF subfamily)
MSPSGNEKIRLVRTHGAPALASEDDGPRRHELDWSILMARAQDGDSHAYLRLLQEITPYLRSRAAKYHRDSRDIEDTVQDVLLTLHTVRHTYDPTRPFGPWLVGIANRRAFDRLSRQSRHRAHEVPWSNEHDNVASDEGGSYAMDRSTLDAALKNLSPTQQKAIDLLKIKEMSLKDASAVTGMSIAALKMATNRALKTLRHLLHDRSEK